MSALELGPQTDNLAKVVDQVASTASHVDLADPKENNVFKSAQVNDGASKAGLLPDVSIPVGLDKSVVSAHTNLGKLADAAIADPAARKKFQDDMNKFEGRADVDGLSADQVKATYSQLDRMLKDAPSSTMTVAQRTEVAGQLMSHLADPTGTTRQGWHDTCGWTVLETKLLTKDPDSLTKTLADAVTTGSVTTVDSLKLEQMQDKGETINQLPTKFLALDPRNLQPDQEAAGKTSHADSRDYLDQIAQVTLNDINWDTKVWTPTGEQIDPGSMRYIQGESITRPSDAQPGDKSGESVEYVDPTTHQNVVIDDHGFGFGGASTRTDLENVEQIVSGKFGKMAFEAQQPAGKNDPESIIVNSPADLQKQLVQMQKDHSFPFAAVVNVAEPGIKEDYLARHPEKDASQVSKEGWHVVTISGLDSKGNAQIANPWGTHHSMTADQLFQAMKKPT